MSRISKIITRLRRMNDMDLMKTAGFGGFFVSGACYLMYRKMQTNIRQSDYYQQAITSIKAHKQLLRYLGEPVTVGKPDLGDNKKNFALIDQAQYEVPINGKKVSGLIYIFGFRDEINDNEDSSTETEVSKRKKKKYGPWYIKDLQISVEGEPNKRILVPILSTSAETESTNSNNNVESTTNSNTNQKIHQENDNVKKNNELSTPTKVENPIIHSCNNVVQVQ